MKVRLKIVFKSIYNTIIAYIKKSLGKGSGWITDLFIDHTISISNPADHNPGRITKVDKDFGKRVDFKDINKISSKN